MVDNIEGNFFIIKRLYCEFFGKGICIKKKKKNLIEVIFLSFGKPN